MIELYSAPTPNGWKVSMCLEEMGLSKSRKTQDTFEISANTVMYCEIKECELGGRR